MKSNSFKQKGYNDPTCENCALGTDIHCKSTVYKISCGGQDYNQPRSGVSYNGETSRSIRQGFAEHRGKMNLKKKSEQMKSFMYVHITEVHSGCVPKDTVWHSSPSFPKMKPCFFAILLICAVKFGPFSYILLRSFHLVLFLLSFIS